ncbi:conserved hypothetical protein [Ricinus communis]|uniref:Uncharacterized protein n=1 Tax=Ricinus communis TaxID=3988 RepID=B9T9Q1_RICCO|nr:conserved hypothetical protein [Ricinus communis]
MVTLRQTRSGNIKFADHPGRARPEPLIQHIGANIGDRTAYGRRARPVQRRTHGGEHRGFGRAIAVVDVAMARPCARRCGRADFAAEDELSDGKSTAVTIERKQTAKGARRLIEDGHPLFHQQSQEPLRGPRDRRRHDHKPSAPQQRPPNLPNRKVEGVGMEPAPDVGFGEPEPIGGGHQVHQVGVAVDDRLRLPGAARGVDQIGGMLRRKLRSAVRCAGRPRGALRQI